MFIAFQHDLYLTVVHLDNPIWSPLYIWHLYVIYACNFIWCIILLIWLFVLHVRIIWSQGNNHIHRQMTQLCVHIQHFMILVQMLLNGNDYWSKELFLLHLRFHWYVHCDECWCWFLYVVHVHNGYLSNQFIIQSIELISNCIDSR